MSDLLDPIDVSTDVMPARRRRHKRRNASFRRGKLRKRGLIKPANTFDVNEGDTPIMTNKEILLGTSDYRDLYLTKFLAERVDAGRSTIMETLTVRGNFKRANKYVRHNFKGNFVFSSGSDRYVIQCADAIIEIDANANLLEFRFHGSFDEIDRLKATVLETFEEVSVYINWIYDANMNSATVPLDSALTPVDEMYPWLGGETLEDYYTRFMDARASILILYGPPGTGKTSFIRGLLTSSGSSANVTYDETILGKDALFSDFIESSSNVLVIEDADIFLSARSEGNPMMHRFLNVGDGLVTVKGKKIIFSTNLPSIKDIDEALLRKGRCHDVIHFDTLNKEETKTLADKLNIKFDFLPDVEKYSISDVFAGVSRPVKKIKGNFGFM